MERDESLTFARMRRLRPNAPGYSTELARRTVRFRHAADFEHWMAGLRKLGWNG